MTDEAIRAAVDEDLAGFMERFTKQESAEDAFTYWGKRMRKVTDESLAFRK